MQLKKKITTTLAFIVLSIVLSACDDTENYHLLYPIEASKQEVLRIQGYRFLSSTLDSPASILVLSNPVKNGGFADFALSLTNNSDKTLHLRTEDLVIKMSKYGELKILSSEGYASAPVYKKPDGFDRLSPKMQAFGCAASNTKDNITSATFTASQLWVWKKHLLYPFKDQELYFNSLDVPPGETSGALFRVNFPVLAKDFEQATVLLHLKVNEKKGYKFKFILQSLQ